MTTIAMGASMVPIAMGWGADPSFRQPMAVAVIGGLITSTFLSLLVIPVVFTYVDDLVAVSYTHLDVYKRQARACANRPLKATCASACKPCPAPA